MTAIARTYVRHKDKCFLVSTINRTSSAVAAYGAEYAETMVWEWDKDRGVCGGLLGQAEAPAGSIHMHQGLVTRLFVQGNLEGIDE